MTKFYCDRCGKESEELLDVVIPVKVIHSMYMDREEVHLCHKCFSEAHDRHYEASKAYLEAFANFIKMDDIINKKKQSEGISLEEYKIMLKARDAMKRRSRYDQG